MDKNRLMSMSMACRLATGCDPAVGVLLGGAASFFNSFSFAGTAFEANMSSTQVLYTTEESTFRIVQPERC